MKTKRDSKANGIKILESALNMVQSNLKCSQDEDRIRLQVEEAGIQARLRELGA